MIKRFRATICLALCLALAAVSVVADETALTAAVACDRHIAADVQLPEASQDVIDAAVNASDQVLLTRRPLNRPEALENPAIETAQLSDAYARQIDRYDKNLISI